MNLNKIFPFIIKKLNTIPFKYFETIHLLNKSFGYQDNDQFNFKNDFAPLINDENLNNSFVLIDKNSYKIVGHIGVKYFSFKENKFKVAFIGGVCIDEAYRGKGHFKQFFNYILENELTFKNLDFAILWGNEHKLYSQWDFYLDFTLLQTIPTQKKPSSFVPLQWEQCSLIQLKINELNQIYNLYKNETKKTGFMIPRNINDWFQIKKIQSSNLFILREIDKSCTKVQSKIIAYYFKGKGLDLGNIIHEIIGEEKYLNDIYLDLVDEITWPPYYNEDILNKLNIPFTKEPLGLVKWLKPENKKLIKNIYISGLDSI
jgi:hypothetical protein